MTDERAATGRIDDEMQHSEIRRDEVGEIGGDVHHDEGLDRGRPDRFDAEPAAHTTAGTVGGEEIGGAHPGGAFGGLDLDDHMIIMLLGAHPSMLMADVLDAGEQQWFQTMLTEIAQRRGGDGEHVVALMLEGQRTDDLATEPGDPQGTAGLLGRLRRGQQGVHVDARLAPDLETAGVDDMRGRCSLGSLTTLEHDGTQPALGAQLCGRESGGTGADDDDIDRLDAGVVGGGCILWHQNTPS